MQPAAMKQITETRMACMVIRAMTILVVKLHAITLKQRY